MHQSLLNEGEPHDGGFPSVVVVVVLVTLYVFIVAFVVISEFVVVLLVVLEPRSSNCED